ncbi:MAG: type II secretion system F family protein [Candidatus Omnitrophica bacterium]|nr:type II secretion system F family protein [Candidatus Omnitrophota bacterium]
MPKFLYTVRDSTGKKITSYEDASSTDELIGRLQARNLIIVNVSPESKETEAVFGPRKKQVRFKHSRITSDDLVVFCRQLATLIGGAVPILKSLDTIAKQVPSSKLYSVIKDLEKNMEGGLSLHEVMAKHSKVFSELWINLVETGEASGNLTLVLGRLASYLERGASFKKRIISSLMYPSMLLVASLGALFFLTIKIIPTFAELFKGFNLTLPVLTEMLVTFSYLIRKYMGVVIGVIFVIVFLIRLYVRNTKEGRMLFERLQLGLPVFGEFFRSLLMERFASGVATLIESGVPILYTLEIAERSMGNLIMAGIIRQIKEDIRRGKTLNSALEKSGFFEPMVVQMVAVGEEVGDLPQMLKRIETFYQEYTETFLARFTALFEPIMLMFMGLVIGMMVLGMFLPIFKIATLGTG